MRDSPFTSCDGRANGSYFEFRCANRCDVASWCVTMCLRHIVDVLKDLGISEYLSPILISEVECVEKPSISIFLAACVRGGATPPETLHVGDDFRE